MSDLIFRGVLALLTCFVLIGIAWALSLLTPLSPTDAAASISIGICSGLLVDAGMR